MSWCTIESDPGVFTELISEIGVEQVQVDEIWSLDAEELNRMKPVYGLVFLFKYTKDIATSERVVLEEGVPGLFFAKQVVTNACATQAIMSVLLNNEEIKVGDTLRSFKEFTIDLDPETRGLAIGNSVPIRKAHNGFARPEPFLFESKVATEDDDVFHFVAYVPHNGKVYEIDGLQEGPIFLGEFDKSKNESWTDVATPVIQERMAKAQTQGSDIKFNLLAIVKERQAVLMAEIEADTARIERINTKIGGGAGGDDPVTPEEQGKLEEKKDEIEEKLEMAQAMLETEKEKRISWKEENERRRFNFVPLVYNILHRLAATGKLQKLREDADKAVKAKAEEAAAKKVAAVKTTA